MSINKLVKKIKRREAYMNHGLNRFRDKTDKRGKTMAKSPSVYKMFHRISRHLDRVFKRGLVPSEQKLTKRIVATTMDRFDFDPGAGVDMGIRMICSGAQQAAFTAAGIAVGDVIVVLNKAKVGKQYRVVALTSATTIRLEDDATYGSSQSSVAVRVKIDGNKKSFK